MISTTSTSHVGADLRARLDQAARAVSTDEVVDVQSLRELALEAVSTASLCTTHEKKAILLGVQRLQLALKSRMSKTTERLNGMGKGRRAVHGYASLRSHTTPQRMYRKV